MSLSILSKISLLIILTLSTLNGCKQNEKNDQQTSTANSNELPSDFIEFYDKFHSDSTYQISRIVFPLEGQKYNEDNLAEREIWTSSNWIIHKNFDDLGGTFTRTYTEFGGIISEKISDDKNISSMERRFSKIQGKWHLIFYDPIHLAGSR